MVNAHEKQIDQNKKDKEQYDQWRELSQAHWSHWRAWGSWFSWGSPVGLGLFLVSIAVMLWILSQTFGWK